MPFETHELDTIKAAVSKALADHHREFDMDAETAQALGLVILSRIDAAAADPADPRPLAPGRRVRVIASGVEGAVVRTVSASGEVHTVIVGMHVQGLDVEVPFGPRELEVIS